MIKVVLERTIRGKHVKEAVLLMRQDAGVLAMQQPGYISGETLHVVDDPDHYLVISAWESGSTGRNGSSTRKGKNIK